MSNSKEEITKAVENAMVYGAGITIDEYFNGILVQPKQYLIHDNVRRTSRDTKIMEIKAMVEELSLSSNIDHRFMFALIETESYWNQWAVRYEPHYRWQVQNPDLDGHKCTNETIREMQSFSYGLCQIMGNHFYEAGYKGICTQLFDPRLNIVIAIKILKKFMDKGITEPNELYAAYNAGSIRVKEDGSFENQENVNRFMDIYNEIVFCWNFQKSL